MEAAVQLTPEWYRDRWQRDSVIRSAEAMTLSAQWIMGKNKDAIKQLKYTKAAKPKFLKMGPKIMVICLHRLIVRIQKSIKMSMIIKNRAVVYHLLRMNSS